MSNYLYASPNLKDDRNSYRSLFGLISHINANGGRYSIDLKRCSKIGPGSLVLLGGAAELAKRRQKNAPSGFLDIAKNMISSFDDGQNDFLGGGYSPFNILSDTVSAHVMAFMRSSKFIDLFGGNAMRREGYIYRPYSGYRVHSDYIEYDKIIDAVQQYWLMEFLKKTPADFRDRFVSAVYEIYANAYGHALRLSGIPVISCTHVDEKEGLLRISILDLGGGVCSRVRQLRAEVTGDDASILRWALARGNSTRTDSDLIAPGMPRGMGFFLLSRFVSSVGATASVYSNSAFAELSEDGDSVHLMPKSNFPGTFFDIRVPIENAYRQTASSTSSKRYL